MKHTEAISSLALNLGMRNSPDDFGIPGLLPHSIRGDARKIQDAHERAGTHAHLSIKLPLLPRLPGELTFSFNDTKKIPWYHRYYCRGNLTGKQGGNSNTSVDVTDEKA